MTESFFGKEGDVVVPAYIRGYRSWRFNQLSYFMDPQGTGMVPLFQGWEPVKVKGNVARECFTHGPENFPYSACSCGFYANYSPDSNMGLYKERYGYIFGSVRAHGRVQMHTKGFRSQYYDIEAVVIKHKGVRKRFDDLGVRTFRTKRAMIRALPPMPVDNLVEDARRYKARPLRSMLMMLSTWVFVVCIVVGLAAIGTGVALGQDSTVGVTAYWSGIGLCNLTSFLSVYRAYHRDQI